ncbi:GTPase IMAP family member 4-like [Haliotis asinina]|uniref:GTPase IMAP family member 4-like n=1 Tax=Haliotis asinina TaxID=109174 RepID=UPI003531A235
MAEKGNRTRFLEREIRMVLVGKTGVGKSETGNTLCGAGIFTAKPSAQSVTQRCEQHCVKRFGYDLQLVDVPGFCDANRSQEDIKQEIAKCVGMSSPGIHAILFVVKIGRLKDEDRKTLELFLQCFGEEAKRFVIVVFTGKDDLQAGDDTIENYVQGCPEEMKKFILDACFRFIAVNNRGSSDEKEIFTKDLIDMVQLVVGENGGQCYTNKMYRRCEAGLQEAEKKENLEGQRQKHLEATIQSRYFEMEKQFEKELTSRKQKEVEELKERLIAVELTQMEEKEKKRQEKEKKRRAELKGVEENMRREFGKMEELQRKQMEFEHWKEDLLREEIRKQIREKIEGGNMGFIRTVCQSLKNITLSLW